MAGTRRVENSAISAFERVSSFLSPWNFRISKHQLYLCFRLLRTIQKHMSRSVQTSITSFHTTLVVIHFYKYILYASTSLLLDHRRNLVQQIHSLGRVCDPRRRTGQASFKVVRSSTQELITNVQRPAAFDATEVLLASHYAPGFVADVDENVVATWDGVSK